MKVERQSAQASNRMTRRNGPRGHLLSTFNKQKEEEIERAPEVTQPVIEADNHFDVDLSPMSSSSLSSPIDVEDPSDVDVSLEPVLPRVPSRPEPGIHDEPLSTEDESSDAESLPARREINYITLEQKLAGNDPSQGSSQSQRKSFLSHPRSDSDDDMTFSGRSSQYQNKRSKTTKVVYTSKAPKSNVFNYPPYPKQSSSPQAKPKPQAKSTPKVKKKTVEEQVEIEKSQPSFKVPMEIEESQSSFKVPMEIGDSSSNVKTKKGNSTFENEENDTLQYYSDGDGGSPLSSISSTTFKNMEDKVDTPPPTKSLCPMCKTEVDPEVLALFQSQKKQRIREQQQFCQSHQLRTAAQQWDKLGYPTILWEDFESRMQDHFSDLEKLLVPDVSSYYRNMLDDVLKAGKAKNFRLTMDCKSLEAITCGYYGAKGANKMLHAVIDRFSVRLRRLASADTVVQNAGVASYAQCVLVPELAMRMVKKDMNVGDETARQIMRDSMEIGMKLNPETNDVVQVSNEETGESGGSDGGEDGDEDLEELSDLEDAEDE